MLLRAAVGADAEPSRKGSVVEDLVQSGVDAVQAGVGAVQGATTQALDGLDAVKEATTHSLEALAHGDASALIDNAQTKLDAAQSYVGQQTSRQVAATTPVLQRSLSSLTPGSVALNAVAPTLAAGSGAHEGGEVVELREMVKQLSARVEELEKRGRVGGVGGMRPVEPSGGAPRLSPRLQLQSGESRRKSLATSSLQGVLGDAESFSKQVGSSARSSRTVHDTPLLHRARRPCRSLAACRSDVEASGAPGA